jgi:hypothetical protein
MKLNRWRLGVTLLAVLFTKVGFSQQLRLGNNPYTVEKSAVLELQSANQGLLFTRIADTALINVLNPPDGMVIYFNPTKQLLLRSNGYWKSFVTSVDTGSISNFYQKVRSLFTASAPITLNNGQIGISQASATTNGYLSSSDWNTFNNKLSSVDTSNIPNFFQKVRSEHSAGAGISYNATTGAISNAGVLSVNGNTGALTMDTGYISNFYSKVRSLFTASAPITLNNGQIGITQASATTNGYLSSSDWNTFNNKLASIDTSSISNFFLKTRSELSAGTGISYNSTTGVISNSGVTSVNGNTGALTMDTGYISNFYSKVRSLFTASAPITLSNGQIGITQASGSTNGYLSSTDWTTFNNKLSSVDTSNIPNFFQKVRSEHSAGTGISYNATTGAISNAGVLSVNGNTGALTMDTTFISNFYQKVRSLFSAGTGIGYNSSTGVISYTGGAGGNGWALGGNTVGSEKKFGTIDAYDLPFITGNTEQMRLASTGNLGIGSSTFDAVAPEKVLIDAGVTSSYNLLIAQGERNGYLQFNITNNSTGGQASTDIVATANNGTETTNYVDLGMNGGGYNSANNILSGPDNGYLYSAGNDFIIGNSSASHDLILFSGGINTSNERMRLTSAGKVGIGTSTPAATLDVAGTYKLGSSGTALNNMIKTSVSVTDNNSFSSGSTKQVTATVTGATTTGSLIINPRSALPSGMAIAYSYISSSNTITIGFINTGAATSPVGTITFDVTVIE